jgi:hypothetical protein
MQNMHSVNETGFCGCTNLRDPVFFNVGKTVILQRHDWCITKQRENNLFRNFMHFKMLGYDTIQYTHVDDFPCGKMATEIVWLKNPVNASKHPCELRNYFRKGWFANQSCECWISPDASKNKDIHSGCIRC